jgi:esterase/lipase
MADIHQTIASIQKEVADIQASTTEMIEEFTTDRAEMAVELDKTFAQDRAERMQNEKTRMKEFNALMKNINNDIKSINDEVMGIFKNTNDMLDRFEKEHLDMSAELRAELGKNLTDRVEYTRTLLHGFQKRLSEIGKENQKTAQKLRKDLANGETTRLNDYKGLMKDIHTSIKGIRREVKDIQKASSGMIGDYAQDRSQGAAEWNKMQDAIAQLRKTGVVKPSKEVVGKAEKKEVKIETPVEAVKETPVDVQPKAEPKPEVPMTLEEKVLGYINRHPLGVKVSEMEEPLGETRMKIGLVAKALLEEGKVQKMDNIYFPFK